MVDMKEPIHVYVLIENGVPVVGRTSLATPGGVQLTVVQIDDSDSPADAEIANELMKEMEDLCPVPLDW